MIGTGNVGCQKKIVFSHFQCRSFSKDVKRPYKQLSYKHVNVTQ